MKRSAIIVPLLLGLAGAGPAVSSVRAEDLTVALSSLSTETLDPVLGGHIVKFYLDQIFDYLVGVTPDAQLSADDGIATRWESSPDHKRWTFHLRRGVRFHNGDELTSDDVKWSLQRAMGKRSTTGYAEPLRVLVKDIETPAPDRVVIVTKEPTLIIPQYLSRGLATEGMIVPKKYLEAKGDDVFARSPVGSGPCPTRWRAPCATSSSGSRPSTSINTTPRGRSGSSPRPGTPTASRWSCTPTSFPGCPRGERWPRRWRGTGTRSACRRRSFPSTTSRSARSGSTGPRRARSATTTSRTGTGSARSR